jgi:phosphoglucosamine mutase
VIKLGVAPDGFNINKDCGSTASEAMRAAVISHGADLGIALDGDADRLVLADEKGQLVDGDQLLALIAECWHRTGRLNGGGITGTVMSNLGLERHLAGLGLRLDRTAVGDRYVIEHMRKVGQNIGGEQSGHIILSDFATTGDGLLAALQTLAVIVEDGRPVSEVTRRFQPLPQVLKSVRQSKAVLDDPAVTRLIDEVRGRLGDTGRLLIRPSGTEPVIRVMAEGEDTVLVKQVVDELCTAIGKATITKAA